MVFYLRASTARPYCFVSEKTLHYIYDVGAHPRVRPGQETARFHGGYGLTGKPGSGEHTGSPLHRYQKVSVS